jgi:Flp pilus assembly protein TadD
MKKYKFKRVLFFTPMLLVLISFIECSPKLYSTGKDFVASGNYEDAVAQFTKLIEENPEYTEAYVARADAYEKAGKKAEAASDYKRATAFEDKR